MPRRLLCYLALALLAACVPPPVDDDSVPDFDPEETRAGMIQERGMLRVALPDEPRPPFSFPVEDTYQGFLVDLSHEIATALDVEVEFVPTPVEDLLRDANGKEPGLVLEDAEGEPIDISFPVVPITEALVRRFPITHPYYVGHQRLLVRKGTGVADVEHLGQRRVCSSIERATGVPITKLNPDAQVIDAIDSGECALLLENGSVDVVTDTTIELMLVWATVTGCTQPCPPSPDFTLVGDDLATLGYGAALPSGFGWTTFVNATWAETDAEGRWVEFHEEWIEPYGPDADAPPELRVEEAAAFYPCDQEVRELKCPERKKKNEDEE